MHVWLINEGEALPCDESKDRLRRMGLIAEQLNAKGHKVTWFNSTFYHARKIQRYNQDIKLNISSNYDIQLIWSNSYKRNISLARIKHHNYTAKRFLELASKESKPDIILCSMPTIELAEASVQYAKNNNIPVVVDIRDLWPDIFIEMVPKTIGNAIWPYILYLRKKLSKLLKQADAITALTDSFLEWGLEYAGRNKTDVDRVFYMAYKFDQTKNIEGYKAWRHYGIREGDFLVSFFGTLGKQFVFEPIFEAAKELINNERIKFIICGDGESFSLLKSKSKNLKNIIFPGWVNQDKISSLLKITSIGLAPYRESKNFTMNIPNKFGEYLSAGIPIMVGINGEMSTLLSKYDCGSVYKDGKHLAKLINELLRNKELLKLKSENAIKLYKERFDSTVVYSEMVSYLQQVSENNMG